MENINSKSTVSKPSVLSRIKLAFHNITKTEWLLILTGICGVATVLMNIYASITIDVLNIGLTVADRGILISWSVFAISNVITEAYGKKTAVRVFTSISFIVLLFSFISYAVSFIPSSYTDGAAAFKLIIANQPRVIISSIVAFWVGNYINSAIIDKLKQRRKHDNKAWFAFRSIVSTIVGQFFDNALFLLLAFGGIWPILSIFTAAVGGVIIETIVESFFIPLITIPLTKHIQSIEVTE